MLWLGLLGLPAYGIYYLKNSYGWPMLGLGLVGTIALFLILRALKNALRRKHLKAKYQDKVIITNIMNREFWQGQTAEQLIDAIGEPEDVDVKVLKTKKKEVWKYDHQRDNRYELRITLDNDVVVGWEKK